MNDLDTIDPTFLADLELSKVSVATAAAWLNSKGYAVIVRPTLVRPSTDERKEFADSGDLEIVQRVEVKRRTFHFTSAEDFPWDTIIVDVAHTWDKAHPKPFAYIIFNEGMSHAAFVLGSTRRRWSTVSRPNHGREREFYECPLAYVTFGSTATGDD